MGISVTGFVETIQEDVDPVHFTDEQFYKLENSVFVTPSMLDVCVYMIRNIVGAIP
jgi:hypothetical protein